MIHQSARFPMTLLLCLLEWFTTATAQEPDKAPAAQLKESVEYQFRDGITKDPMLRFFGPGAGSMASIQPEGLQFTIPADRKDTNNVGIESKQRLRGDFEITLQYELIALPDPLPKLGAGIGLGIVLDTPDAFKARLGRARRPTGAVFAPSYVTLGPDGKELPKYLRAPPADDKETKGLLRLARTGTKLTYQAAEGGGGFRVIATAEIGPADVIAVQAHCNTGWAPAALEARFPRLELRASEIPKPVTAPPAAKAQAKAPDLPAEGFYHDFRGQKELPPPLAFFGHDPLEVTRFEKEGLRITLPPIRKVPERVGVQLTERIKGDFEITATYEIQKGGQPTEGSGVGVELLVSTDSATKEEVNIFRAARVNEGEVHMTNQASMEGGNRKYLPIRFSQTNCKSGRLRITRVGSEAILWAAEGNAGVFQELDRRPLGPEDVTLVRLNAYPGHRQNELDLRIIDLRVRGLRANEAAALPPPSVPVEISNGPAGKGWLVVVLVGGIAIPLLAALIVVAILFWRRRKPAAATDSPKTFRSLACPECGKKLKVKAELAGKKVKCGQCGKAVLVAGGEQP